MSLCKFVKMNYYPGFALFLTLSNIYVEKLLKINLFNSQDGLSYVFIF